MRSLAPLESEMVPPPAHDPDSDPNPPAPCARASTVSSRNASAKVAPRHARAQDGIDRDGMDSPSLPPPGDGAASAGGRCAPIAHRPVLASIGDGRRFVKGVNR